ncbi:fumarylacetoacetate hydrolase family protein [Aquirhabdus sp.]|uniref:fumarylacetoacetate hydrolase family protein n=1 Tax=Aquirhabdus sp. TaxID=2824160 RepID=UPI00396CDC8E
MSLNIVRYQIEETVSWGVLTRDQITPLDIPCSTTGDLLAIGLDALQIAAAHATPSIPVSQVTLLSPITASAKVLCQGANYRQHIIDSGLDPDAQSFNMFFTKSSAAITDPQGAIIKPSHVKLLDYEIELTLVLDKKTTQAVQVTADNLHDYVAGICIGNDVSARDVQIPQMQFHKGKSYRTFCPLGPVLCLLSRDEMHYLNELNLTLSVNGEVRQSDSTANLVFKPAETLTEFSQIANFEPGDVLMTGTPSGCALGLPPPVVVRLTGLLPEAKKWQLFKKSQQRRSQYLQAGDRVELHICSSDGYIDLGRQQHTIVASDVAGAQS